MRSTRRPTLAAAAGTVLLGLSLLPVAAPASAGGTSLPKSVSIATARADWKGTGISPAKDVTVKVTATGNGTYCDGCIAPTPAGDTTQLSVCGGGYSGLGGVACIALVGRWAGGSAFVIGKGTTLTAPGGKELELGIHDWKFDDNTGSYTVKLRKVTHFTLAGSLTRWQQHQRFGGLDVVPFGQRVTLAARGETDTVTRLSDGDGSYSLHVPAGETVLRVRDETRDWQPGRLELDVDTDRRGLDFHLCPPVSREDCDLERVTGRMVDHAGAGYEGFPVTAVRIVDGRRMDHEETFAGGFLFRLAAGTWRACTVDEAFCSAQFAVGSGPVGGVLIQTTPTLRTSALRPRRVVVRVLGVPATGGRFLVVLSKVGAPDDGCAERAAEPFADASPVRPLGTEVTFERTGQQPLCTGAWDVRLRDRGTGEILVTQRVNIRPPETVAR